jgi:hypothetical protein
MWVIWKRYSHFDQLNRYAKQLYSPITSHCSSLSLLQSKTRGELPKLPAKTFFAQNGKFFAQQRGTLLENYLQEVVTFQGMLNNRDLKEFLGVNSVPVLDVQRRSFQQKATHEKCVSKCQTVEVPSTSQLDSVLADQRHHLEAGSAVFGLFTGSIVPETGKSWCPDCTAADPKVQRVLAQFKKPTVLLECPVLRSEYKGNAHYAYRQHPLVQLKAVPQLVKWILSANGEMVLGGSLVEDDCANTSKLNDFFFPTRK